MRPLDQPDPTFQIDQLTSDEPRARARMLAAIAVNPMADTRLLTACEQLLADKTITLLSLPYTFGEIRWLAADAVAAVRKVLSITEPVTITNVFAPCSTTDVARLAAAAGLTTVMGGIEGVILTLETLAAMDRLPRRTITRSTLG